MINKKNSVKNSASKKTEVKSSSKNTKTKKSTIRQSKPADKSATPKKKGGIRNIKYLGGKLFAKMVRGGTSELRTNADEVNRLNVFPVPDGDTGDNMRMTIESGFAAIENVNTDYIADVMKLFAHGMLIGARGNSGVILSQFFAGLASGLESEEKAGPQALAKALEIGVDRA